MTNVDQQEQEQKPKRGHLPTAFKPGNPGRAKGSENKIPKLLKDLIMQAGELEGSDGEGKDGMLGLLRRLAKEDLRTYAMLLARIIPLQVEARTDMRVDVVYRSVEEVRAELEERGISMEAVQRLMIEHDEKDIV